LPGRKKDLKLVKDLGKFPLFAKDKKSREVTPPMRTKGFTLIELLIVVAIIAILAAIAVPNFLEAQVRSKVSRVKADMRSLATAIESYYVDYNKCPYDGYTAGGPGIEGFGYWYLGPSVTTPIAYMTSVNFSDPFRDAVGAGLAERLRYINTHSTWSTMWGFATGRTSDSIYLEDMVQEVGMWRLNSAGPDKTYGPGAWVGVSDYPANPLPYDPTNGTISDGDVQRTQNAPNGYINAS
jgi:general secretion pathway protein G